MDEYLVREFLLEHQSRPYGEVKKSYAITNQGNTKPLDSFFDKGEFLTLWSNLDGDDSFNYASVYHSRDPKILNRFRDSIILMAAHFGRIELNPNITQWGMGIPNVDKSYTNSKTTISVLESMAALGQLEKHKQQNGWGDHYFTLPK
jgi:hypothetical protein